MLNSIIDSLETKYFAVFDDLNYVEISSLDSSSKIRPTPFFVVEKKNIGKTISLFNEKFFAHSNYRFYDLNLNEFIFIESGWQLRNVIETMDRSRSVIYQISDPTGEMRNISNLMLNPQSWSEYFQIEGICKIILFIRDLTRYPDWNYYDLANMNKELDKENKELKMKIQNLENNLLANTKLK